MGVLFDTVSHATVFRMWGHEHPAEERRSNSICVDRTPDSLHRDMGDMSDRGLRPEEEGDRRPTLYLVLDPDQDPSSSSEAIMLVGTKEELRSKTGGDDVVGKGV